MIIISLVSTIPFSKANFDTNITVFLDNNNLYHVYYLSEDLFTNEDFSTSMNYAINIANNSQTILIDSFDGHQTHIATTPIKFSKVITIEGNGQVWGFSTYIETTIGQDALFESTYENGGFTIKNFILTETNMSNTATAIKSKAQMTIEDITASCFNGSFIEISGGIHSNINRVYSDHCKTGLILNGGTYSNHISNFMFNYGTIGILLNWTFWNTFETGNIEVNTYGVQHRVNTIGNQYTNVWFDWNTIDIDFNENQGTCRENVFTNFHSGYNETDNVAGMTVIFGTNANYNTIYSNRMNYTDVIFSLQDNGNENRIFLRGLQVYPTNENSDIPTPALIGGSFLAIIIVLIVLKKAF